MKTLRTPGTNSSSVSIQKAHLQNVLSDTNEHEKPQTATLSIEGLRNIGHIVRDIKARINDANGHGNDNSATCFPIDSVSTATSGPLGREDHDGAKEEK
jgi:hypothetical protein